MISCDDRWGGTGGLGGWRRAWPLLAWCGGLGVGLVVFHSFGQGPMAPPVVTDPGSWSAWVTAREPAVAVAAMLRLVVLALAWYLVGATAIGIATRLVRRAGLVRLADMLTVPPLRRLLQAGLGVGLASAMVGASVAPGPPGMGMVAVGSVTQEHADGAVGAGSATDAVPARAVEDGGAADGAAGNGAEGGRGARGPVSMRLAEQDAGEVGLRVADGEGAGAAGVSAADDVSDPMPPGAATPGEPDPTPPGAATPGEPDPTPPGTAPPDAGPPDVADGAVAEPVHRVAPGESLWSISREALAAAWDREPTDAEVVPYWSRMIERNRAELADPDNPDLLFPGDGILLPPVEEAG